LWRGRAATASLLGEKTVSLCSTEEGKVMHVGVEGGEEDREKAGGRGLLIYGQLLWGRKS
jgi:hypothetical protein